MFEIQVIQDVRLQAIQTQIRVIIHSNLSKIHVEGRDTLKCHRIRLLRAHIDTRLLVVTGADVQLPVRTVRQ